MASATNLCVGSSGMTDYAQANAGIVLIVDDEDDHTVDFLKDLVTTSGLEFRRASTWKGAWDILLGHNCRAMFLDLHLGNTPGDGFFLLDMMLKKELLVPTTIVSASADLIGVADICGKYPFVVGRPYSKGSIPSSREHLKKFILQEDTGRPFRTEGGGSLARAKVFMVHGHDTTTRDRVKSILEGLDLDPLILNKSAREGKTLIELFEKHAAETVFAIILLTDDDVGYLKGKAQQKKPRARQNVIFEMGFFYGQLGRSKVLHLYKPGVEKPTDIDGIAYVKVPATDTALERCILKELQAAGIPFKVR